MASLIFSKASSSVFPCDQHPGKPGTQTAYPSSVFCRFTLYFIEKSPLRVWLSKAKPNDNRSWHSKNVGFRFTQPNLPGLQPVVNTEAIYKMKMLVSCQNGSIMNSRHGGNLSINRWNRPPL